MGLWYVSRLVDLSLSTLYFSVLCHYFEPVRGMLARGQMLCIEKLLYVRDVDGLNVSVSCSEKLLSLSVIGESVLRSKSTTVVDARISECDTLSSSLFFYFISLTRID